MLKILQRYLLREVLVPTVMALAILTFLLLVQMVFKESDDLTANISFRLLMQMFAYWMPTLLTLTLPMAVMIGTLLGIARMAADSEIKAMRTHGVNLFPIFAPVIVVGVLASAMALGNSMSFAPRMMDRSFRLLQSLTLDDINALAPERFIDGLDFMPNTSTVLYFKEKDAETGDLKQIYLSIEGNPENLRGTKLQEKATAAPAENEAADAAAAQLAKQAQEAAERTASALKAAQSGEEESILKTLILATSGSIHANAQEGRADLELSDGTIHVLPSRGDPMYDLVEFDRFNLEIHRAGLEKVKLRKSAPRFTSAELGHIIAELKTTEPADAVAAAENLENIRFLRAEQLSRISISLACLAFVLIAMPLAIYIHPSGKSVGITIAFVLILVYFGCLFSGVNTARNGFALGPILIFLPNALLMATGAVLIHRVVHR